MKKGRIRTSLRISFMDGVFASAMVGFTVNFWVACAEATGVTALQAGLAATLPNFICSLAQIYAEPVTAKLGGRVNSFKTLVCLQWLSLLPLLFLKAVPADWRYLLLMGSAVLFAVGGSLPGPAWLSLMSDHLPARSRGKYMGWRNRIMGMISFATGLLGGQILQYFHQDPLTGFSILYGLAFLCRVASWTYLIRMYDVPARKTAAPDAAAGAHVPDSIFEFLSRAEESHFVRFTLFVASFFFAVSLVSPYLTVYMLRDLGYSYSTFAYVTFTATLVSLFGVKIWGELADKFGSLKVARATALFAAVVPLLWAVSGHPYWLVAVQLAAGFAWSGLELTILTYSMAETPQALRTKAISYLQAMNGAAVFLGSLAGGSLLKVLPAAGRSAFVTLFFISAGLRMITVAFFYRKLRETRPAVHISTFNLYADALGLHPMIQTGRDLFDKMFGDKKP